MITRPASRSVIVLSERAAGDEVPDEFAAARKELLDCGPIR
ncbi:hypothetical protein [Streptomyces sp. NBC_01637]|nr:hypothetical protein OG891_10900 [Streptomyces sp. NBC_01637]